VPEVASRRHLELVTPVVQEALAEAETSLDDVDLLGVTAGPGLIGALLVGVAAAKAIAWARRLPLAAVDHLQGHVASLYSSPTHSNRRSSACWRAAGTRCSSTCRIGRSAPRPRHDARRPAGEAFDKGARLLGLGYPGGAEIDRLAREGDPSAYEFPVARIPGLDFSFSGVRRRALRVRELPPEELERRRGDLAASYQRAIVRALVERTRQAADKFGATRVAVVGGVAANSS